MSYLAEQVREWVWIHGQDNPDTQWLSSPMDTWELNPHYHGPDQPHPESYIFEDYDGPDAPEHYPEIQQNEIVCDDFDEDIPF